jgi:hypothetical protein
MVENGKWSGIYGLDGIRYQSIAEMIVGNWLFISNIFYIPHAPLPFKSSRRFRESDFGLENNEFIEVFLCSELSVAERGDMPSWVNNYQFKRQYKLDSAQNCGIKIITIEAEIYRLHGYKKYISHIKDVLSAHNYHLVDLHNRRLDISGKARGFNWNIDDFINYARNNNLKKLSDFVKVPHSDLYKILIDKNFRDDVRFELDKIYNRKTEAEGKFLVPIEIVKTTCIKLGITQRLEYEDAYKNNLLPFGFPYSVRQSYGINWDVFISGRSRSDFMEFIKAREYVRSRKFKSKSEFTFHVQTDPSMKYIRKNPAAPSGGYPEFVSWPDFLGKTQ